MLIFMIADAYVNCFENGEFRSMSKQQIRDAFGSYCSDGGAVDWQLYYADQNIADIVLHRNAEDSTRLDDFVIIQPCRDIRLWDSLAKILKLGNFTLTFSTGKPLCIADAAVAKHVPAEIVQDMGQPVVVHTGQDILNALGVE
jgi:hypothetical protein